MEWSKYDRVARIGFLIVSAACLGSCSTPPKRLTSADARVCRAQGGYESRAPFGSPFCQFRYSDAGNACSGKADCQGRCLYSLDGQSNEAKVGDVVAGQCEAEHSTFGCYGTVEGGELATNEDCWD
jgi:hypothetical protein